MCFAPLWQFILLISVCFPTASAHQRLLLVPPSWDPLHGGQRGEKETLAQGGWAEVIDLITPFNCTTSPPIQLDHHMSSSLGTTRYFAMHRDILFKLWQSKNRLRCPRGRVSQTWLWGSEAIQLVKVAAIQRIAQQRGPTNWQLGQTDGVRASHTKSSLFHCKTISHKSKACLSSHVKWGHFLLFSKVWLKENSGYALKPECLALTDSETKIEGWCNGVAILALWGGGGLKELFSMST